MLYFIYDTYINCECVTSNSSAVGILVVTVMISISFKLHFTSL